MLSRAAKGFNFTIRSKQATTRPHSQEDTENDIEKVIKRAAHNIIYRNGLGFNLR